MEAQGQSDCMQKKKARTRVGCDVACQTELAASSSVPPQQSFHQPSSNASSQQAAGGGANNPDSSPSASASGASTPAIQPAPSSPAPSSNQTVPPELKKIAGPAGVKPNEIEAYFGEKKPAVTHSSTTTNTQTQPAVAQQKVRAVSTTGVVGEAKKQTANATSNASSSNATNGTAKTADGPSWADENSKLRLVINQFSQLEETMCSKPRSIEGVSWKIMVMPKQHMVQKKQQKCMGFFLQCAPERAYSDQWSVHAVADMRMISYKPNVPHFARRTTHTYTSKENDWGYSCFMTWADIIDEGQGYIRDDTVCLEIAVKAEAPKNMMSHEDFLDKIEKWIVLADMQMKKGNIDLALEANQSAMKFCKGKDDVCYTRLETQRETFVNAKLFESIERIEKGPVAAPETTNGKPTSLRQALTGAQKSLNGKMTAKGGKKTRAVVTVQHMKKKKPYDQRSRNTANQQRNNTGATTVKDLVEKRKSNKSEESGKKQTAPMDIDLDMEEEEVDVDVEEQTDSEESPDEKARSEEEDEIEFDDEEYNEGEYGSQADECSTLELFEEAQDLEEDDDHNWEEDHHNHDGDDVHLCDRMVQTEFSDDVEAPSAAVDEEIDLFNDERMIADTVIRQFQDQENGKETVHTDSYYTRTGINTAPEEPVEAVFGGGEEAEEEEDTLTNEVIESLPVSVPAVEPVEEETQPLQQTEKMLKSWLDLEGALSGNVDPEGVLARLSDTDRQDLLDELNQKINPLIVALDHEFRETVSCANTVIDSARTAFASSQKMIAECDKLKDSFEEKLLADGFNPKNQKPAAPETNAKKTTSAAATSGAGNKTVSGRPTVIAKRSMKQVLAPENEEEAVRPRVTDFLGADGKPIIGAEETVRMRDALENFKELNRRIQPMMATIHNNNDRLQRILSHFCADGGIIGEKITSLYNKHNKAEAEQAAELKAAKDSLELTLEERKSNEKKNAEHAVRAAEELEKSNKVLKELKEVKTQLKKAESKATKEENRATTLQVQVNEIDEKAKILRKELETLKKKSTEERAKVKKEKDRDTQTIRQQNMEIIEKENERDKARKELEEVTRQKEKFEKDKKAVAGQLTSMTDRARGAEVAVMESKWNTAHEELKKRREAIQHGFSETETLANRTRQVSDRDMMRKSLAEWKAALDKIDAQIKSVKADYDHATEHIKNGVKTLSQTLDIKMPAADPLPNLVKPPPVQVVAPSPSVIAPPVLSTPAAGVIGQPRTPIGTSRQGPSATVEAPAAATPSRTRVPRVPSPVGMKNAARADDTSSSLWSWNTIGTIGNLGELREPSRSETSFNSSMDSLQRDIWAANGNGNGSLGPEFLRGSTSSMGNGMVSGGAPQAAPSYIRSASQPQQPQPQSMSQASYQQSQMQHQHHQNNQRMQQQQPRGYGDMWNAQSMQQQNAGSQDYGNRMMGGHNGGGDMSNGQGYSPWHNPPSQQQLRGPTPQQQSAGGHHNMFQSHNFFDNGM